MSTETTRANGQTALGEVVGAMSISLDGFVADANDGWDRVLAWYGTPQPSSEPPGERGEPAGGSSGPGVIVAGRRTFEIAEGWGGSHPTGSPVVVVCHRVPDGWPRPDTTVLFNTDGIEQAIEQGRQIACGRDVALATPTVIQQCPDLGLVDRLHVSVVPVLLGDGIRLFGSLTRPPVELAVRSVAEGNGVTHLTYQVHR